MRKLNKCIDCGRELPELKGKGRKSPRCDDCRKAWGRARARLRQEKHRAGKPSTWEKRLAHADEMYEQGAYMCCITWYLSTTRRREVCPQHRDQRAASKSGHANFRKNSEQWDQLANYGDSLGYGKGRGWGVEDMSRLNESKSGMNARPVPVKGKIIGKPPEKPEKEPGMEIVETDIKNVEPDQETADDAELRPEPEQE